MRLPGCTRPVAGRSARRIISGGAKFMKDRPRSGSRVNTAPTRKRARPSSIAWSGRPLSSAIMRSSSHTTPCGGTASVSASGVFRPGAMRSLPRKGYPGVTPFTDARSVSSPERAMLTKLMLSAPRKPRLAISPRNSGAQAWSAVISTSAPSTWCASRVSACRTRSAKKETLATPPTASTSASASTRSSPARQSRTSIRRARRRIALALAVDAAGDEPDLAGAAGGDRVVVGHEHERGVRFRVHLEHEVDHARAGRGVEIAGRLVGKEELRLGDEGARKRHALLLAAGQRLGVMPQPLGEAHAREHFRRAVRRAPFARELQGQHHVLQRVQRRQQLERLEHEAEEARAQRRAPVLVEPEEIRAVQAHGA